MNCSKCQIQLSNEEVNKKIKCDQCKASLCQACSGLNSSEVRVMQLVKRILHFICGECETQGRASTSTSVSSEREMKSELVAIKNEIERMNARLTSNVDEVVKNITEVKNEVVILRESNIQLLHVLPISGKNTSKQDSKDHLSSDPHPYVGYSKIRSPIICCDQNIVKPKVTSNSGKKKETRKISPRRNSEETTQNIPSKQALNKKNIGQSESTGNFKGATPKVWLYLSRVSQKVTEEDIKLYLKNKTGDEEDFVVKDLKEGSRLKSYAVAADFKYKDQFYKHSFWPKDVSYRRFDFNKHYEKHKTRNITGDKDDSEGEQRPLSFSELPKNA